MALKPDRDERVVDISYFYNSGAVERGIIMVHDTTVSGSGAAMDQSAAQVLLPTGTNWEPAGLLLNDVVNINLTRQHLNQHQDEVQNGSKVALLRHGWVVTNKIVSGIRPQGGDKAYHSTNGELTTAGGTQCGRWMSAIDEDGYAKVEINII